MPICFIPLSAGAKKMVALTSTCMPPVLMSCMLCCVVVVVVFVICYECVLCVAKEFPVYPPSPTAHPRAFCQYCCRYTLKYAVTFCASCAVLFVLRFRVA